MSLTVVLIAVSSIFSIKKLTARIALEVCLVIPFIFEIWWRHTAMEAFDAGSLAGHMSRHSLRKVWGRIALDDTATPSYLIFLAFWKGMGNELLVVIADQEAFFSNDIIVSTEKQAVE